MKKFVGVLIIIFSSLLMIYWIIALSVAIKWGYVFPLQPIDIIFPIVAVLFMSLGILLLKKKPQEKNKTSIDIKTIWKELTDEQFRYQKAMERKEKRLEEMAVNQEDYNVDIEPKYDSGYAFLTKKETVDHYSVERIFTAKRKGCFSEAWILFFQFLYPLIFVLLFVFGAMNQSGKAFAMVILLFLVSFAFVWVGHTYMLQMNAKAKICGIVLTEQWGKDRNFPIGKEFFYIASTSDIATQMKSFSFGRKSVAGIIEEQEQVKRRKEMLVYYQDMLAGEEFKKNVEQEINHPNDSIEGWLVTPMHEARLGKIGFWGTKVSFKDRRGTSKTCFVYRDFTDYKQIKKIIKDMNHS